MHNNINNGGFIPPISPAWFAFYPFYLLWLHYHLVQINDSLVFSKFSLFCSPHIADILYCKASPPQKFKIMNYHLIPLLHNSVFLTKLLIHLGPDILLVHLYSFDQANL